MLSMVSGKQHGCSDLHIACVMWRVRVDESQLKVTHNASVAYAVKCMQQLLPYPFAPRHAQWSEHRKHEQAQEIDYEVKAMDSGRAW